MQWRPTQLIKQLQQECLIWSAQKVQTSHTKNVTLEWQHSEFIFRQACNFTKHFLKSAGGEGEEHTRQCNVTGSKFHKSGNGHWANCVFFSIIRLDFEKREKNTHAPFANRKIWLIYEALCLKKSGNLPNRKHLISLKSTS